MAQKKTKNRAIMTRFWFIWACIRLQGEVGGSVWLQGLPAAVTWGVGTWE